MEHFSTLIKSLTKFLNDYKDKNTKVVTTFTKEKDCLFFRHYITQNKKNIISITHLSKTDSQETEMPLTVYLNQSSTGRFRPLIWPKDKLELKYIIEKDIHNKHD